MLGKLTKYEFMATAKNFLPLYGAIIIISIINRIFVFSDLHFLRSTLNSSLIDVGQFFNFMLNMIFFAIIIAIGVITLLVVIQRFYKNLYGDQGYLMHTLPVPKWELIASKVLVSVVWIISSGFIIFVSISILVVNTDFIRESFEMIKILIDEVGFSIIFEGLALAFAACISSVLCIYAAISLGNMFNSFKVLWSFGAYIAFALIESNIAFIGINVLDKVFDIFNKIFATDIEYLIMKTPHPLLLVLIAFEVVTAIAYFFVSHIIMSKKLNLQ
ncbi:MAG: hypothetical protein RR048_04940 [Oscillospiraceae bacterium]